MSNKNLVEKVANELISTIELALGEAGMKKPLPLHVPFLDHRASDAVLSTLQSGFVSSVGPAVGDFERRIESFTGVQHCVSTSSGTSALQLALKVHGVAAGDHVAVPALSFIATANAVSLLGAVPVFVDSVKLDNASPLGLSVESLQTLLEDYVRTEEGPCHKETKARLSAVVPMHTFGRLTDLRELKDVALDWGIQVVEDAAEAIGSFWNDKSHPGKSSSAILSFNGNKTITTGGGGALLTNSEEIALKARHLSTTAKIPHPWRFSHDAVGWNFRMPALNAALGIGQMEALPEILAAKENLYMAYKAAFQESEFFGFMENPPNQQPNNWLIAVRLKESNSEILGGVLDESNNSGINCRAVWDLLPNQRPYRLEDSERFENAKEVRGSVVCLPSSPALSLTS
jgi:perosamine synthetase